MANSTKMVRTLVELSIIGMLAASPIAEAQTIPPEAVRFGPYTLHYADSLCASQSAPLGQPFRLQVIPHSVSATYNGQKAEIFTIWAPDVKDPAVMYNEIPLNSGDRVLIYACGCVQTGGKGNTWKSYFDPKGSGSDRLYSGTVGVVYSGQSIPPQYWKNPTGLVRIKTFVQNQGPGFVVPPGKSAAIVLGYQDDGYPDNGYDSHDDGDENQCRGVGAAAVDIIVFHPAK